MKTRRIIAVAILLVLTLTCCLVACNGNGTTKNLTDQQLSGTKIADFSKGSADAVFATDGYTNGDVFNVWWSQENVTYTDGAMHLSITDKDALLTDCDYYSGEARTYQRFGYGDFEVSMKPAKKDGTASTFFIYTDEWDTDEDGNPNPHDEIDIEFLGKDTTKVQFNYFVAGQGGHEFMYNLGFDASEEYHTYGFRWAEDYITWFVDGKPVYKVTASKQNPLPSTPSRMMMNYWCGTPAANGWMGQYSNPNGESADYQWIATSATPIGTIPDQQGKPNTGIDSADIPTQGWVDIDYSGFGGWNGYAIVKSNGLTMSHTSAMNNWKCEGMALTNSYSWVKFTIKNNGTGTAAVRIDVKQESPSVAGVAGVYCDTSGVATYDEGESVAIINLDGGQSVDVVLKIKDINVDQFVVFLNSMQASGGVATGSITITALQGIKN